MRLLVLFAFLVSTAPAPKQAYTANGAVAAQPLHEVIMQVFDKDHNGKVSLPEVDKSLTSFAAMAGAFGGDTAGPNKMAEMVEAARKVAPHLFELLDADDSKSLSSAELKWVAKVQKGLKSGALRNLTRDVFDTIDIDADSVLTATEMQSAAEVDGEVLPKVVELVHEALPIRKSAAELQALLTKGAEAAGASGLSLAVLIKYLDNDGDGQVDRKEAGRAFKAFKDAFLQASKSLQEMGPMLAMFGDMDESGGGGMGGPSGRGFGRGGGRGSHP